MATTYRRPPPLHMHHQATQKLLSSPTNNVSYSAAVTAHANAAYHPCDSYDSTGFQFHFVFFNVSLMHDLLYKSGMIYFFKGILTQLLFYICDLHLYYTN